MLYSAATLRYKNGISVVLSVKCQPSKLSEFLRVDNERSNAAAERERERLRGNSQCLFMPRCGLGLGAVMVLQQGHACCT